MFTVPTVCIYVKTSNAYSASVNSRKQYRPYEYNTVEVKATNIVYFAQ